MLTRSGSLGRLAEALENAQRHWHEHHEAARHASRPVAPGVTVAVAREAGALGTSVAHEVGARLGWPVYDHELLEKIAQEMGLRTSLVESVDERHQNWLEESMVAFAALPGVTQSAYVRHLVQTLLSLAAHGDCVIVGRGAAQVLPPASTLRVRLIGALPDRVAFAAHRRGVSAQEAARWVEEADRERIAFIKDHFHKDPTDPGHYDLVLNTSRWGVKACADFIVAALEHFPRPGQARSD